MSRLALVIIAATLAGCATADTAPQTMPWQGGNERFQQCLKYASVSYCRDDIYGHGS